LRVFTQIKNWIAKIECVCMRIYELNTIYAHGSKKFNMDGKGPISRIPEIGK